MFLLCVDCWFALVVILFDVGVGDCLIVRWNLGLVFVVIVLLKFEYALWCYLWFVNYIYCGF